MSDSVSMRNYSGVTGLAGRVLPGLLSRLMSGLMLGSMLALLAACAGNQVQVLEKDKAPNVNVNLAGFPAEYRKAYGEGCAHARSGGAASGAPVIVPGAQGAQQAAQGWRDGFDYCKRNPR